jgi:hypothetical protein
MGFWATLLFSAAAMGQAPGDPVIAVDAGRVLHRVSPYLYGACIEDVNHEIYGGIYSQMIFGESFGEPPRPAPLKGFTAYGGRWEPVDGEVRADPGAGPKLVADVPPFADGEVGVEVFFPNAGDGNAGLILKVDRPGEGADAFTGYEVSLETAGRLAIGRHRRNWEPIRSVACPVPVGRWIALGVRMAGRTLEVRVDGKVLTTFEDTEHPLGPGRFGLRTWQRPARFRNLRVEAGGTFRVLAFEREQADGFGEGVSGMWAATRSGSARGDFAIETGRPFAGRQSQRLRFLGGEGEVGIENRGLNRRGLNVEAGKPYEGHVWARASSPTPITLALESGDGGRVLARTPVEVRGEGWNRYDFAITPNAGDRSGRFALKLTGPGSVDLGHAFLQPGDWGRFQGLPDRKDVAEALVAQGITVLRYGGSMVNHPDYRWKRMIGPRDRRPPVAGTWYPHSSNGWGIFDFLDLCEAAGFLGIPALNMGESPQDMADFVEYANGPADSEWGRRRAADGHPAPYRLKHLELGNEEAINDAYFEKFRPIAEAMWARDPGLILVVGDFAYNKVIVDPYRFEGGAAANSLAAHRKILELARERGREVWFDVHVWTDHPPEPDGLRPERSYIEQLGKLAPGARFKVVIFEYNSGNHAMKRALSNALATIEAEKVGDLLPIACAANCLQVDGQNDNGWDQGLLFLNPARTWLQPPGHLIRMVRRDAQPLLVACEVRGPAGTLAANAKRSEDGKSLVVQVVNWGPDSRPVGIELQGFTPTGPSARVEQLAGPLDASNTAEDPDRIKPARSEWRHGMDRGRATFTFAPRSFTVLRFE